MADVYEQNLGQKSSLTTSDFIRVVGSDNVSYKQVMSNVMDIMGVIRRDLTTSITAYADTLDAGRIHLIRIATTDVATVDVPSGYQYSGGVIYRETNGESVIVLFRANADGVAIRRKYSGTWASWAIQPTRAEVDALKTYTSYTHNATVGSVSFQVLTKVYGDGLKMVQLTSTSSISISTSGWATAVASYPITLTTFAIATGNGEIMVRTSGGALQINVANFSGYLLGTGVSY